MNTKLFWVLFAGAVMYWSYGYIEEEFLQEDIKEVAALLPYNDAYKTDESVDEDKVTLLRSEEDIASGKSIYDSKCAACHGMDGVGNAIGSNLIDRYWIEGGSVNNIFKVIKYGIPEKGMIAWEGMLSHKEMEQIISYIISSQGTNPPNAKEPQGELYEGGY